MPKVPGASWASVAEDLRDGAVQMSLSARLRLSLALTRIIDLLEAAQCSHRDLSGTNVFLNEQGRIWLIDFDSLYHASLPFQANTTVGTMGYVAPFLKVTGGHPDPASSWRPHADRFALAVLIAEILLTGLAMGPPQEDGTLFAQSQIDELGNGFVRETIDVLKEIAKPCGLLLERALESLTFEGCPSPPKWIGALKGTLQRAQTGHYGYQDDGKQRFIWVLCAQCRSAFSIAMAKHDELRRRGKLILCKRCLSHQFAESSLARAQHQLGFPEVSCEHCHKTFSLPRPRVDDLRHRGRPILCSKCLRPQLEKWRTEQAEHDISHPLIACAVCGKDFRLPKDKLEGLQSRGKRVLCRDCLTETRDEGQHTGTPASVTKIVPTLKPWDYFRRILHGRTA